MIASTKSLKNISVYKQFLFKKVLKLIKNRFFLVKKLRLCSLVLRRGFIIQCAILVQVSGSACGTTLLFNLLQGMTDENELEHIFFNKYMSHKFQPKNEEKSFLFFSKISMHQYFLFCSSCVAAELRCGRLCPNNLFNYSNQHRHQI